MWAGCILSILYRYVYNKGVIKLIKMNLILAIVFVIILIIYIFNYLFYRRKRDTYFKAGKKWDGIVKELSNRK